MDSRGARPRAVQRACSGAGWGCGADQRSIGHAAGAGRCACVSAARSGDGGHRPQLAGDRDLGRWHPDQWASGAGAAAGLLAVATVGRLMAAWQVSRVEGAAAVVAELKVSVEEKLRLMAEDIKLQVIAYLKSLTTEVRGPARKRNGEWTGPRRAHPGHWADVESVLVNSYGGEVTTAPGCVTLVLYNTAEYAVYLDVRMGYFVLRGVTEPGGPVEQAFRLVLQRIAPDW